MNINEARRWLTYAKSDLDAAYTLLEKGDSFPRQICFFAQQAGEKALKAILIYLEINFPKIHDLDRIRELIPTGWEVKEKFPELYDLSVWAVESRYPGHTPDVVEHEARETLRWQRLFLTRCPQSWKNGSDKAVNSTIAFSLCFIYKKSLACERLFISFICSSDPRHAPSYQLQLPPPE